MFKSSTLPVLPFALALAFLAVGCGTSSQSGSRMVGSATTSRGFDMALEDNICKFNHDWDPKKQFIAHIMPSGQPVAGDVDLALFRRGTSNIPDLDDLATAMARPKQPVFRKKYTEDCYDEKTRIWTRCEKLVELDFSQVRGISRTTTMKRSEGHAIKLCEQITRKLAPEVGGLKVLDSRLECVVTKRTRCRLPEATDDELQRRKDYEEEIEKERLKELEELRKRERERLRKGNTT